MTGKNRRTQKGSGIRDQTVTCITTAGEKISIRDQIHLYTPNYMLTHPLISPVVSYLGGLPPMFVIAGDGEVLRDEIIYMYVVLVGYMQNSV